MCRMETRFLLLVALALWGSQLCFCFITRARQTGGGLHSLSIFQPFAQQQQSSKQFHSPGTCLYAKKKSAAKDGNSMENESTKAVAQKEADLAAAKLLGLCSQSTRSLEEIAEVINELQELSATTKPAQSAKIYGDWRLAYVSAAAGLDEIGTGLHKLPLTRMEDLFLSFSGSKAAGRAAACTEVLRVLGPFPNLRNKLSGDFGISSSGTGISLKYTQMIDGTGKMLESGNGMDRKNNLQVIYSGLDGLVMLTKTGCALVFQRETNLQAALKALRVDD